MTRSNPVADPGPDVRLRPAVPEDAHVLGTIIGDWVRETGWMPALHTREADRAFVLGLIRETAVTVAEEGRPVGFLAREGEQVRALCLAPGARGRGVGRALLGAAKAASPRLRLWTFEANAGARRFYAREGFEEVRRTDGSRNEERLPDVCLDWERP